MNNEGGNSPVSTGQLTMYYKTIC